MKQNAGIFTAIAVVLAVFGLSSIPKGSPASGGTAAPSSAHGTKSAVKILGNSKVIYACGKIQERLQVLMPDSPKSARPSGEQWRLPDSCYGPEGSKAPPHSAPGDVTFAIATAPNPVTTHLALLFDRTIEIIEQAAQDNNYSYDSSWLPWSAGKEYARYPDQRASEDSQSETENQPGVLVFRKPMGPDESEPYVGGLVVFVVAELPTGGIDEVQFGNAIAWIKLLGHLNTDKEFKILGPTFSGSLPSLYELIRSNLSQFKQTRKIHVSSGSVSSDFSFQWFNKRLDADHFGSFETGLEGDCRMLGRFVTYAAKQGYRATRIAVLSEDETAFGGGVVEVDGSTNQKDCSYNRDLTYLYYPRDIATLRSAYEQQSIFSSGTKSGNNANTSATTLRSDLSEPENSEHDTVRTYSGQLTPLAQESVLLAITDVLATRQIEFVILRSTNSLDQIFLSQFLRRSFPDARLVLDNSDLLFRRGAEGASLRGAMVLSTYPLLTWEQDWTSTEKDDDGGSYRIFGQDNAEGLYIAAREILLNDPTPLTPAPTVKIANYAPPAWARSKTGKLDDDNRPATWLTVIGHRQFWPVAILNADTMQDHEPISLLPVKSNDHLIKIGGNPDPIRFLPAEFQILLILCFLWGFLHFLFCWKGSISPVPRAFRLAYFAPVPRWQYAALIGFGSVVMVTVAVLLASTSGLLSWKLGYFNLWVAAEVALIIFLACGGCALNYQKPAMEFGAFDSNAAKRSRLFAAVACLLFLAGYVEFRLGLLHRLTIANQIPLFWRSIHLLSGVSPLLPQLILAGGLYGWFWFCLRGLALFGNDRPLLPEESELPVSKGKPLMPMFSCEGAGQPTEAEAIPLGKNYLLILGIIFPIVLAICAVVLRGRTLRTLGEREFGEYMFILLAICIAMILADAAQCWLTWLRLRELLKHLDRLTVRRTLYALQGLSWRSVWAMSGNVLAERYSLISRQLEAMRHLENRLNFWTANMEMARGQAIVLWKIHEFQKKQLQSLTDWYVALNGKVETVTPMRDAQAEIASIAAETAKRILFPAWKLERASLLFAPANAKSKDSDTGSGPVIAKSIPVHVLAAEEFFVLPYVGFIQNILGRIRTIVLGSLCLFVATTLAMSSYPFDPLPVLGGIFLAVFVIIGTTMILIYAGMHRDATLSYITGSQPGELGGEFWRQLITFGIGPLLGLLTTLFPSITDFVVSWLQPSAQAIK